MKWLREISTQYIPGVEIDGETVNFRNSNFSWEENYFTVLPLSDGELIIKAYDTERLSSGTVITPPDDIVVYWRLKGSNSTWTSLSFSKSGINVSPGYVTKTVSLTAGLPIELKCSTGLSRSVSTINSGNSFPGSISTDCPAIIMGQLESLVIGEVNTSGVSAVLWSSYLDGLKGLFRGWTTLIDASCLIMPKNFQSGDSASPDFTGLFSGCSSLISSPIISHGGIYTECFKDCRSLRSIYANLTPSAQVSYTLTDWLKGTYAGNRVIYVPETLDASYNLYLEDSWTRENFEF